MARSAVEDRMLKAVAVYLKTVGWKALVIGGVSIAKDGPVDSSYQFRLKFLGGKMAPKVKPPVRKKTKAAAQNADDLCHKGRIKWPKMLMP